MLFFCTFFFILLEGWIKINRLNWYNFCSMMNLILKWQWYSINTEFLILYLKSCVRLKTSTVTQGSSPTRRGLWTEPIIGPWTNATVQTVESLVVSVRRQTYSLNCVRRLRTWHGCVGQYYKTSNVTYDDFRVSPMQVKVCI